MNTDEHVLFIISHTQRSEIVEEAPAAMHYHTQNEGIVSFPFVCAQLC